jgi:hypothetical protein
MSVTLTPKRICRGCGVVSFFLTSHNQIDNDNLFNYCDMGRNETV